MRSTISPEAGEGRAAAGKGAQKPTASTVRNEPRGQGPRARTGDSPTTASRSYCRVAPGDCSPGAPTDPDVQNYCIRLVRVRARYVNPRVILGVGSAKRFPMARMRSHESTPSDERRLSHFFQILRTSQTNRDSAREFPGRPKYP